MSFNRKDWSQMLKNLSAEGIHEISLNDIPGITDINGELTKAYKGRKNAFKCRTLKSCYESCGFEFVDVDFDRNVLKLKRISGDEIVNSNVSTNTRTRNSIINHNNDLDMDLLELNSNNRELVAITANNANIILDQINKSSRHGYVRAIPKLYEVTTPDKEGLTIDKVIQRLIIIDTIDSVNIGTYTKAYEYIAESIVNSNLENYIKEGKSIPNNIFKQIAYREGINVEITPLKLFSAITKYIARTAHYIYHIDSGYPIYDSVLGKYLHHYIPDLTKTRIAEIKNNLDYESYCSLINNYLNNINRGKEEQNKITNLMFDQIIWYTHKTTSAPQKYR